MLPRLTAPLSLSLSLYMHTPSVSLSTCLSFCLSDYIDAFTQYICLSASLSVCLSVCLAGWSVCPAGWRCVQWSLCLSSPEVCLADLLVVFLSSSLSVCLSGGVSVSHCTCFCFSSCVVLSDSWRPDPGHQISVSNVEI